MAMTAHQLDYFRSYRAENRTAARASFKKWHDNHARDRYYSNLELTRAIKRKCYYKTSGNEEKAAEEQELIDRLRAIHPRMSAGMRPLYAEPERVVRRKAVVRKARYRHVSGIPDLLDEPKVCEICGGGGKICLDHCHVTSTFRGWICDNCNQTLGRVKDDINILKKMIAYLERK